MFTLPDSPITLVEYQPKMLPPEALPLALGQKLWREYGAIVNVEFPSPKTAESWQLTAQGWVGYLPLTPDVSLYLQPKVSLSNLLRMWEYAYQLRSFRLPEGLEQMASLADFYERLAHILARRVLDRARQGLHRAYVPREQRLPYVRGQLQLQRAWQRPAHIYLTSRYEEHTADIPDNQILAYTLGRVLRGPLQREEVQTSLRRAYRTLTGAAAVQPFEPVDCIGRFYTRLNQDYQPLHALCRFFLEQTGPHHERGDRQMLPFLVNMARLYERFVAEWLKSHLPTPWTVRAQEQHLFGERGELQFNIDLVLYDETGWPRMVLDTKYKTPEAPATADVSQVIAYAKAISCGEAVLVYPERLKRPLAATVSDLRVRSLTFALDGDLETAGQHFLAHLDLPTSDMDRHPKDKPSAPGAADGPATTP